MSPLLIKISKDFATLWTTIDPIGNVALFAGLTAALTRAERRRTALRATIYAAVTEVSSSRARCRFRGRMFLVSAHRLQVQLHAEISD